MPEDMEVVIALYLGHWPHRGNSGITDPYAVNGEWHSIPESVHVVGWLPLPDTAHLPIAEHYDRSDRRSYVRLGDVETQDPSIVECIFAGDYSEIARNDDSEGHNS